MSVWLLLIIAAGDPNEWSSFPTGKPTARPGPVSSPSSSTSGVPDAALQRYRDAVAHVSAGRYQDATLLINQLASEYPKVAELYATRCSAQLGLKQPTYAEADCAYALKLKPTMSTALYGLASAEEALGKKDEAARHFREYEHDPSARADLKQQAGKRADALMAAMGAAPTPPPPPGPTRAAPTRSSKPECRMGSNGRQACGYNCEIGADGISACADTPDGACAQGADGHVTCTQLAVRGGANAGGKPPECRTGTDGLQVCGYNCRMGTNGRFYCATMPEGECAMNTNGTFTCP
jgi:hypothetical protein